MEQYLLLLSHVILLVRKYGGAYGNSNMEKKIKKILLSVLGNTVNGWETQNCNSEKAVDISLIIN